MEPNSVLDISHGGPRQSQSVSATLVVTRTVTHADSLPSRSAIDVHDFGAPIFMTWSCNLYDLEPETFKLQTHFLSNRNLPITGPFGATEVLRKPLRVELLTFFSSLGTNPYDISQKCEGGAEDPCYPVTRYVVCLSDQASWLRSPLSSGTSGNTSIIWESLQPLPKDRLPHSCQ